MENPSIFLLGGMCLVISVSKSLYLLVQHLRYFYKPEYQLYICRIVLLVPIYCITSFFSLLVPNLAEDFNIFCHCYEAFVIYSFTTLLINYVGGERRLTLTLELKDHINHPWPFHYFFHSFHPGSTFLRLVKIGVLQFVIVRPLLSVLTLVFDTMGIYHNNSFDLNDTYFYIFVLSNISFTLALYGLLLFFVATEELLEPYNPILKFLCIKGVIFFSFWQGIALSILQKFGVIKGNEEISADELGLMINNLLICVEMVVASFVYAEAFGYEEYAESIDQAFTPIKDGMAKNIKSILLVEDVIQDVKDSISPKEFDFELKN